MARRQLGPRDFSTFWERKLSRHILNRPTNDVWNRTGLGPDDLAERRHVELAFRNAMYGGSVPRSPIEPRRALEVIEADVADLAARGHAPNRITAVIPVAAHRQWCDGLVTVPAGDGWPTHLGVRVIADTELDAPDGWEPGDPAIEEHGDRVLIEQQHLTPPIINVLLPPNPVPANSAAAYRRLRADGWTIRAATDAVLGGGPKD